LTMPERIPLREAFCFAEALREAFLPYCHRVEIAGSVRRESPGVKDIELVVIPKWEQRANKDPGLLFAEPGEVNLLYEWACEGATIPVMNREEPLRVRWIKPSVPDAVPWHIEAQGKYWRASINDDYTRLDVFLCVPETWGMLFFIRTGPREFVTAAMVHAIKRKTPVKDLRITNFGKPVATPEERDVFRYLNLTWVEPQMRRTKQDLERAVKRRG
jgi:DNA polymerase/3'-5' exonuclease PolX